MLTRAANGSKVNTVALADDSGNPQITVTPVDAGSFEATDTYVLTGTKNGNEDGITSWAETGGGCDNGYC